jgi:hypothetical protein
MLQEAWNYFSYKIHTTEQSDAFRILRVLSKRRKQTPAMLAKQLDLAPSTVSRILFGNSAKKVVDPNLSTSDLVNFTVSGNDRLHFRFDLSFTGAMLYMLYENPARHRLDESRFISLCKLYNNFDYVIFEEYENFNRLFFTPGRQLEIRTRRYPAPHLHFASESISITDYARAESFFEYFTHVVFSQLVQGLFDSRMQFSAAVEDAVILNLLNLISSAHESLLVRILPSDTKHSKLVLSRLLNVNAELASLLHKYTSNADDDLIFWQVLSLQAQLSDELIKLRLLHLLFTSLFADSAGEKSERTYTSVSRNAPINSIKAYRELCQVINVGLSLTQRDVTKNAKRIKARSISFGSAT